MQPLEWLMRAMTHLNIGAAIAMLAWVFSSGLLLVSNDTYMPRHAKPAVAAAPAPAAATTQEARP